MPTETVSFEVPEDLLASLKTGTTELGRNIRLLAAITYFQEKKLSLGKAAQLAGMNRLVFMDVLAEKGIVIFDYDESMLTSELSGITQLKPSEHDHGNSTPLIAFARIGQLVLLRNVVGKMIIPQAVSDEISESP